MSEKTLKPPYPSYKAFENTIKELKEHEHPPAVIDRSYLRNRSGGDQSALMLAFRWFGLTDEENKPTHKMQQLISANEESSKAVFRALIEESYEFVGDGSFDLLRATTNQMAEKFREYGISGSTLTKSISFFLAAARATGIQVGPHVKPPKSSTNTPSRRKPLIPKQKATIPESPPKVDPLKPPPQMISIPLPIFGGGAIHLPANMDKKQWDTVINVTELVLKSYRDTIPDTETSGEGEL